MKVMIRLQKYLAQCGIASRRKSEAIITAGRVSVDGKIVTGMGLKINPEIQKVMVDNKLVEPENTKIYILLNKPVGYVTTLSDPQGRPIVTDLVQSAEERLFPVGRLDLDTEGALILTNDGQFAQKIQHPSHSVTKTYEALVSGFPSSAVLKTLEKGIDLDGKKTAPANFSLISKKKHSSLLKITLHEGRKRQIRRMCAAAGHPVITLKRIAYGSLFLGKLPKGSYRSLTPKDLKKIFKNIPLQMKK